MDASKAAGEYVVRSSLADSQTKERRQARSYTSATDDVVELQQTQPYTSTADDVVQEASKTRMPASESGKLGYDLSVIPSRAGLVAAPPRSTQQHVVLMVTSTAGGLHVGKIVGTHIPSTIRDQFSTVIEEDGTPARTEKSTFTMAYLLAELKDLGFALDSHQLWAPSGPAALPLPMHFFILSLKPSATAAAPLVVNERTAAAAINRPQEKGSDRRPSAEEPSPDKSMTALPAATFFDTTADAAEDKEEYRTLNQMAVERATRQSLERTALVSRTPLGRLFDARAEERRVAEEAEVAEQSPLAETAGAALADGASRHKSASSPGSRRRSPGGKSPGGRSPGRSFRQSSGHLSQHLATDTGSESMSTAAEDRAAARLTAAMVAAAEPVASKNEPEGAGEERLVDAHAAPTAATAVDAKRTALAKAANQDREVVATATRSLSRSASTSTEKHKSSLLEAIYSGSPKMDGFSGTSEPAAQLPVRPRG